VSSDDPYSYAGGSVKFLGGSPKPDRSKDRSQTKCNPPVLVGGWAWC
jgi:hypothetical protein